MSRIFQQIKIYQNNAVTHKWLNLPSIIIIKQCTLKYEYNTILINNYTNNIITNNLVYYHESLSWNYNIYYNNLNIYLRKHTPIDFKDLYIVNLNWKNHAIK